MLLQDTVEAKKKKKKKKKTSNPDDCSGELKPAVNGAQENGVQHQDEEDDVENADASTGSSRDS